MGVGLIKKAEEDSEYILRENIYTNISVHCRNLYTLLVKLFYIEYTYRMLSIWHELLY